MSRLCVKNLPKNITESKLRETFSSKGEVTDARLVKSSNGKSRMFGFVGYRHESDAKAAQEYFNHSYIGAVKIIVEFAQKLGDKQVLEKAWSKHTKEKVKKLEKSTITKDKSTDKDADISTNEHDHTLKMDIKKKAENKPISKEKLDFMEVMKSRNTAKKWANDESMNPLAFSNTETDNDELMMNIDNNKDNNKDNNNDSDSDDDDDEYDDINSMNKNTNTTNNITNTENTIKTNNKSQDKNMSSELAFLRSKVKSDFSDDEEDYNNDNSDNSNQEDEDNNIQVSTTDNKKKKNTYNMKEDDEEEDDSFDNHRKYAVSNTNTNIDKTSGSSSSSSSSTKKTVKTVILNENTIEEQHTDDRQHTTLSSSSTKNTHKSKQGQVEDDHNDKHVNKEEHSFVNDETDDKIQSGRLFIRNLSYGCTEEELTNLFSTYGTISEIHIPLNTSTKVSKGYGFVQFMIPEHAEKALSALDGSSYQGRVLHIIPAKDKYNHENTENSTEDGAISGSTYKQKKEKNRKTLAGFQDSWNASYVRSDTVVASLADKYGVKTGDVMNTSESGGELAVRLAIGETQIIQENQAYLINHGVNLKVLESIHSRDKAKQRSNTTILIKNLPHDTNEDELQSMFIKFGNISSFILPPSKAIALIEYIEPSEARQAFKGLAYRKYKHMPLYLEWAPLDIINKDKASVMTSSAISSSSSSSSSSNTTTTTTTTTETSHNNNENKGSTNDQSKIIEDDNHDEYSTLFIKNLNFNTTEIQLQDHIIHKHAGEGLRALSIPTKTKGTMKLSMGFGFAEYNSMQYATQALTKLHQTVLDGHTLEVKPSDKRLTIYPIKQNKTPNSLNPNQKVKSNTKLIVRNVAFQATQTELRALFSTFGSVKRVRIPRKMGGQQRGFAFVEMSSNQEAQSAMISLTNSHLYGRHLVIEWAKQDDNEDDNDVMNEIREDIMTTNTQQQQKKSSSNTLNSSSNIQKLNQLRKRARQDERVMNKINASHGKKSRNENEEFFSDVPSMNDLI